MGNDYSFQYLELLDQLLSRYIGLTQKEHPGCFNLHGCSIETALKKFMFVHPAFRRQFPDKYFNLWKNNTPEDLIRSEFYDWLFKDLVYISGNDNEEVPGKDKDYVEQLSNLTLPYRNKILYYSFNFRLLQIALPVLSKIPEEVIVLTEKEIPEEFECSENISAIEFQIVKTNDAPNYFLRHRFPWFYYMFNNIELIVRLLAPKAIVVIEGVHPEFEMLAVVGKKYNIPVVCLQQGWPGLIHTRFREMQYDKFLCWGDSFSHLLKPFNPKPRFVTTGYPYEIPSSSSMKKRAITFFFQGPFFISNEQIIEQMAKFAGFCSESFPNRPVLIREHPEYPLGQTLKDAFLSGENIKFMPPGQHDLAQVLQQSLLSISIFSSTIMESLAYGSIPFIFNPTSMPRYYPDLHKEQLGIEVKSLDEAKTKISGLMDNPSLIKQFQERIALYRTSYFKYSGEQAINNIIREIITP